MDKIQYISPSAFYYWENCPLQAVISKLHPINYFFPKNPDADLGSLIHKFYEKQNEWKIDSVGRFDSKWKEEIKKINAQYQEGKLQSNYYPIQWNAKYYEIKKQSLCNSLLFRTRKTKDYAPNGVQYLYEYSIGNEIIGGKIDLLIKEDGIIKQIVDFKTGNIYEKNGNTMQVKEVYKQQLALYSAVILEKQDYMPDLILERIDGKRVKIEVSHEFIEDLTERARMLIEKINSAIENNTTDILAKCKPENCEHCNYRPSCKIYKDTFINRRIGSRIDISGKIKEVNKNEITIETKNNHFNIKKIKDIFKYKLDSACEVYNLFFPENSDEIMYETLNTVIIYAK